MSRTAVHVAVRDALSDLGDGDLVLVACSGGPDSLALAAAAAGLARPGSWRAGAVIVDHGWSAAAREAGEQAVRTCRELGLDPVELVAVDSSGPGGPEGAARTARYQALAEAAERHDAKAVLLGHTLDDQAETVLLGLGRGSGARSLAGMAARIGSYRRPFLGLTRATTVAACAELGLEPWLDPANDDPAYTRVRVRQLAAELERALGPGVVQALARSADLLRDDADALDEMAADLLVSATEAAGAGELDVGVLKKAPAAIRRRALLAAARDAGCPAGSLSHRHALALDGLLEAKAGARADLPGGITARIEARAGRDHRLCLGCGPSGRPGMGNLPSSPEEPNPRC
jgi:tRNA(Ile)-lysidine synthase